MNSAHPLNRVELTVLLPVLNERSNVVALLPRLARVLAVLGVSHEVLVVDGGSQDGTAEAARELGARVLVQVAPGYGAALREGFAAASGAFLLTLDADLSHDPDFIHKLWRARRSAEMIIASRYVRGGVAYMPWQRRILSRILNRFFAIGLSLPLRDLSSGFRLYNSRVLKGLSLRSTNFEILEEVLVRAYMEGWRVIEVPFTYYPREHGTSHARILPFGLDLLRAFVRLWSLRNSIHSADYDERAFDSRIPLQRYWQRKRCQIITTMARGAGRTLDVGCGSSVVLPRLNDVFGLDIKMSKLRYMRRYDLPLVNGSIFALPLRDDSFDCVVCSQVIEHVPAAPEVLGELVRVLRPGGLLILGTPDYATIGWNVIEPLYKLVAPGGYGDEHITHYTAAHLAELAARHGLEIVASGYVCGSELIMALRKSVSPPCAGAAVQAARSS